MRRHVSQITSSLLLSERVRCFYKNTEVIDDDRDGHRGRSRDRRGEYSSQRSSNRDGYRDDRRSNNIRNGNINESAPRAPIPSSSQSHNRRDNQRRERTDFRNVDHNKDQSFNRPGYEYRDKNERVAPSAPKAPSAQRKFSGNRGDGRAPHVDSRLEVTPHPQLRRKEAHTEAEGLKSSFGSYSTKSIVANDAAIALSSSRLGAISDVIPKVPLTPSSAKATNELHIAGSQHVTRVERWAAALRAFNLTPMAKRTPALVFSTLEAFRQAILAADYAEHRVLKRAMVQKYGETITKQKHVGEEAFRARAAEVLEAEKKIVPVADWLLGAAAPAIVDGSGAYQIAVGEALDTNVGHVVTQTRVSRDEEEVTQHSILPKAATPAPFPSGAGQWDDGDELMECSTQTTELLEAFATFRLAAASPEYGLTPFEQSELYSRSIALLLESEDKVLTRTNLKTNPSSKGPASSTFQPLDASEARESGGGGNDAHQKAGVKFNQTNKSDSGNDSSNNNLIRKQRLPPTSFVLHAIACLSEAKLLNVPITINHYMPLLKCPLLAEIDKDLPLRLLADAATTVEDTFRDSGRDKPEEAARKAVFKAQVAVAGTFAVTGNWQQALLLCGTDPTFAALVKSLVDSQQWPWAYYLVNQVVDANRPQYLRSVSVAEAYSATARAAVDYGMRVSFAAANPISKKLSGNRTSDHRSQNGPVDDQPPPAPSPLDAAVTKLYLDFSDPSACAFAVENSTKYAENQVAPYNCRAPDEVTKLFQRWCKLTEDWISVNQPMLADNGELTGEADVGGSRYTKKQQLSDTTYKFMTRQMLEPLLLAAPPGNISSALAFLAFFKDHYHRRVAALRSKAKAKIDPALATKLSEVELGEVIPFGIVVRGLHRSSEWRTILKFFCETNGKSRWRKEDPRRDAMIARMKEVLTADKGRSDNLAFYLLREVKGHSVSDGTDGDADQIPIRPNVLAGDRWSASDDAHILLSLGQAILCQNGDVVDLSQPQEETASDTHKVSKVSVTSELNSELDRQLESLRLSEDIHSASTDVTTATKRNITKTQTEEQDDAAPIVTAGRRSLFTGDDVVAFAELISDDNTHKHMAVLHILSRGGKGCPAGSQWSRCVEALQHTDPLSNIFIDLVIWQLTAAGMFTKANEVFENFMRKRKRASVALGSHHQYPKWPIFSYLMLASSAMLHSPTAEAAAAALLRLIELGAPRIDAWNVAHAIACLLCVVQTLPTIPDELAEQWKRQTTLLSMLPQTENVRQQEPKLGITYMKIRSFNSKQKKTTLSDDKLDDPADPVVQLLQLFRSGKMDAMRPRTQYEYNNLSLYLVKQVQSVCKYYSEIEGRSALETRQKYIHNHDDLRACHMSLLRRFEIPEEELAVAPRRSERMLFRLDGAAGPLAALLKELTLPSNQAARANNGHSHPGGSGSRQGGAFSTEVVAKAVVRMGLHLTLDTLFD